jgi:hypothetical protein
MMRMVVLDEKTGQKYEATAYVRGTEEDRQRQEDEIRTEHLLRFLEGDFVSDWRVVERRLAEIEQDNKFVLVVTDLQVLSKKPKEWAERAIVFVKRDPWLWPLKYDHNEWWARNCRAVDEMERTSKGKKSILTFLENQYRGLIEEDAKRQQAENAASTQESDKSTETKERKRPQETKRFGKPKGIKRGTEKTEKSGNEKGKNTLTKKAKRKPKR